MGSTRRSRLQKAIITVLRRMHDPYGPEHWCYMDGFSRSVAREYNAREYIDHDKHVKVFERGANNEMILSSQFKVSYSRSLKKLVEQGVVEVKDRDGYGYRQIRLSLNVPPKKEPLPKPK